MKKALLIFILFPLPLMAQVERENPGPVDVSGRVVNVSGEALPGASLWLVNQADTLKKFGVSTRDDGTYALAVPAARYHLRVSYVGFRPYAAEVDATSSLKLPDIFLKEDRKTLDAITVTGKTVTYNAEGYVANIAANKQLQQLPLDRMLAFLPGMYVDREKIKVYLNNVSTVYINDRAVRLTGQELIDHLKAYDGKNIQKIEVIVNNGVEHSASGFGSSSIRITTEKVIEGGMVSANAEASYNKTNQHYGNPSGNFLWRYGDWSFNLNASGKTYFKGNRQSIQETHFLDSGETTVTQSENNSDLPRYTPVNLSIGYDIDKNNLLTFGGSYATRKSINENRLFSQKTIGETLLENHSQWYNSDRSQQASASLSYVHRLENGRLSFGTSYGKSWENSWQDFQVSSNEVCNKGITDGSSNNETYGAKIDFSRRYKDDKEQLKLGASFSSWTNHSNTLAEQYANDVLQEFGSYEDIYCYREQNYALYASYDMNWKRLNLQLGLRLEHMRVSPESRVNPERNHKSNYTNLFPNVQFNYAINPERGHNLNISYARAISAPNMNELNPAMIWENEYTYRTGNPYLKPTFAHQVDMRMNLFNGYAMVVQYIDKKVRQTVYGEDGSGFLCSMPRDGGKVQQLSAALSASIMSVKNLMLNGGVSYSYIHARYESKTANSSAWNFNVMASYQLPWDFHLEASAMYNIPEKGLYQSLSNWWSADVYLGRDLSENWSAGISYVYSSDINANISSESYIQSVKNNSSPHTIGLRISYSFKWGEWLKIRRTFNENVLNRIGD